ncbi:hypothetical protein ACFCV3_41885 [Kribbella sp. NPDC056345]|uniref:hypothetical protein n=1 Tax=Kribbella sp. NPDC056345 TaxID=3345789 RepID=UPI0035DC6863
MAQTTATVDEVIDSLTGHDELALHAAFGKDITELAQVHRTLFLRAAVTIHSSRETGDSIRAAYKRAMDMPMSAVADYFTAEDADVIADEPDSDSGKDD